MEETEGKWLDHCQLTAVKTERSEDTPQLWELDWREVDILCSSSDTAHQLDELDILKLEEKHWTGDTCDSQTMDTLRSLDTLDTCQPWLTSPQFVFGSSGHDVSHLSIHSHCS